MRVARVRRVPGSGRIPRAVRRERGIPRSARILRFRWIPGRLGITRDLRPPGITGIPGIAVVRGVERRLRVTAAGLLLPAKPRGVRFAAPLAAERPGLGAGVVPAPSLNIRGVSLFVVTGRPPLVLMGGRMRAGFVHQSERKTNFA